MGKKQHHDGDLFQLKMTKKAALPCEADKLLDDTLYAL